MRFLCAKTQLFKNQKGVNQCEQWRPVSVCMSSGTMPANSLESKKEEMSFDYLQIYDDHWRTAVLFCWSVRAFDPVEQLSPSFSGN